jgi:hypothetical protein
MGVRIEELRRVCQLPVRERNDVAGLLFGDHASLPITKLFVDLRISPNYASIGFLVAGLAGAGLQASHGMAAWIGALLLVLYYVLDCVDGEVARYQRVVAVQWGYYDYLFHMLIKPLTFFGVSLGCAVELLSPWFLCAAFTAAVSTLWLKIFLQVPGILFLREVLRRGKAAATASLPREQPPSSTDEPGRFQLRLDRVTLRAVMTNFDVGLLFLAAACTADLFVEPFHVAGAGPVSVRALWLVYYGVVLPIDFADYMFTYLRRGHYSREMMRLLALAHHFRCEGQEGDGSA